LCGENFITQISDNINFFIENKIKIVKASNNNEVSSHGFIIEKPFIDYSFEQLFLRDTLKFSIDLKNKLFNNKKILITGGAGSVGSGLVIEILKFNIKKIYILDNNEYNMFKLKNLIDDNIQRKKVEYCLANIENKKILEIVFNKFKPDIIFHAAALKHVIFLENNIRQAILTNVIGTKNVLDVAIRYSVKYFIHVSTDKAADPKTILGYTKLISEEICKNLSKSKIVIGIVRFGNVFNSYGSVAEKFKSQIITSKKIQLSHPKVERFFMSANEATSFILSTLEIISKGIKKKCRIFICDMGGQVKIIDLAKKMLFLSGRIPERGISNKFYGLNKIEKISEKLLSTSEKIISNPENRIYEIEKIKKKININNIIKLAYGKLDNKKLKLKLDYMIKTNK
jgi:FlaA1/EpsC-like NDP-sugar epimerase